MFETYMVTIILDYLEDNSWKLKPKDGFNNISNSTEVNIRITDRYKEVECIKEREKDMEDLRQN